MQKSTEVITTTLLSTLDPDDKRKRFHEEVSRRCVEALTLAYIVPKEILVMDGIILVADIYGQYHLYVDLEKHPEITQSLRCLCQNGVGSIEFLLLRKGAGTEEALLDKIFPFVSIESGAKVKLLS